MSIKLEISNHVIHLFIAIIVVLVLFAGVSAYNSGQPPSTMGHTKDEIEGLAGSIKLLSTPIIILNDSGSWGGASSSGDIIADKLTVVLTGVSGYSSDVDGAIITISSAFRARDDEHAIQRFYAWSTFPTDSLGLKSPYLVLGIEAGKLHQSYGEADLDYTGGSNTFMTPLNSGTFQIAKIQRRIEQDYGYSLVLLGFIV